MRKWRCHRLDLTKRKLQADISYVLLELTDMRKRIERTEITTIVLLKYIKYYRDPHIMLIHSTACEFTAFKTRLLLFYFNESLIVTLQFIGIDK